MCDCSRKGGRAVLLVKFEEGRSGSLVVLWRPCNIAAVHEACAQASLDISRTRLRCDASTRAGINLREVWLVLPLLF